MSSYNKIQLANGQVLIDLTSDTVDTNKMLYGYSAHKSDGTIVSGTLFEDYPNNETLNDVLTDSSGLNVIDSLSDDILYDINYVNALSVSNDINSLQMQVLNYQQAYAEWVSNKTYLLNHCLVDSSGSLIDIS